jgi:hypothetical protein
MRKFPFLYYISSLNDRSDSNDRFSQFAELGEIIS